MGCPARKELGTSDYSMEDSDFIKITRTTTAQQVAEGLQNMILRGVVLPGSRLNESSLSESLAIFRNTVREAIRLLESTGLVRRHPNGGMAVWDPTNEEI